MGTQERTFRWIEVVGAALASAITSAVVVSWTISATLQELKSKAQEQDRRLSSVETTIQSTQSLDSLQTSQLAVTEANYKNIILSLDEIKTQMQNRR
jgi:membrane-bound ClpP family serine protease